MATIYLIRHGQASFGKDNYDQLSPTGWAQGRVLGRWLAGKVAAGAAFGGGLQRHRETLEALGEGYGQPLPALQTLPGLDEFDHMQVVERFRPEWADRGAMARDLAASGKPARTFQKAYEAAMVRWTSGDHDSDYTESWLGFQARVLAALDELVARADGQDALVATSGGPIAVITKQLLGLSDDKTLAINNVIANTSVSRVLYSGSRRSLAVFNNYSHLEAEDPALVTFR
ncbi:histidine phosphatase family protein [Marinobacter sp. C2H3]|uniref:histidine phosphatase family protein n=1 Tax=Marinobacter sp. C2H3 TaxID=3119003 RepID=UPI00300F5AF1